ncbi:RNA-binding S4 domain-containing protein [Methylopila sp. 73B]|uniref:RNA-binding S4 domain-containing protein n=1 Tax=Methylopila sp. 73B TaxID=1120792 RepID=UPI000367BD9F|nr:RNA-binding S4 domain-containing protein [Methylopila sp. 73B]
MAGPDDVASARLRIDVWLWRARVAKTRARAAELAQSGHVRVNGQRISAAGRGVKIGDVLTIALEQTVRVLRVAGFGDRRGPATEARALFDDLAPHPGEDVASRDDGLE